MMTGLSNQQVKALLVSIGILPQQLLTYITFDIQLKIPIDEKKHVQHTYEATSTSLQEF